MNVAGIIKNIEAAGVQIHVGSDRIRLVGKQDAVARASSVVARHKSEIIEYLTGAASAAPFCDPTERGWLFEYKVMDDLTDCGGYPRRCGQCRLLILSGECLLSPEVDA